MANLVTTFRLGLVFVVIAFAYLLPPVWKLINVPLLILVFALDGVDGYVARKRGEESLFGSVFDVAADRIIENVLWIALVGLDLVPVWVAILFIVRGFLVDAIRSQGAQEGKTPFGMMQSALGRWLVGGKFMRIFYAVVKAHVFCWLLLTQPLPEVVPQLWAQWSNVFHGVSNALIFAAVILCLARGIPVILEFVLREVGPMRLRGMSDTRHGEPRTR